MNEKFRFREEPDDLKTEQRAHKEIGKGVTPSGADKNHAEKAGETADTLLEGLDLELEDE